MCTEPKGNVTLIVGSCFQQEGLQGPVAGLFGLVTKVREGFVEGASRAEAWRVGVGGEMGARLWGDDIGCREEEALRSLPGTGENSGPFP